MAEAAIHRYLAWGVIAVGVVTFAVLMIITAPYGRHNRKGWGPTVANRPAWILMESPSVLAFLWIFFSGTHRFQVAPLVLCALWQWHYVNRTFIFPFRLRTSGKRMPLLVVVLGALFNGINAYLNARWIAHLGNYPDSWLTDPRFLAGAGLFALGWLINTRSDAILLALRKPGETGYRIPMGGLYRWVSSPNYLGELLEWGGWSLATSSLAGVAFFVYTAANLVPRALTNHRWYHERFDDYPPERKAIVPFIL